MLLELLALGLFVLIFYLIVLRRWSALKVMPLVWIVTLGIVAVFWGLSFNWIGASFIKGVFLSAEILLIIFGAIWVLELLKESGRIKVVQGFLSGISDDARVQALLIAFLFGSLIEGVAGFGTPAVLAAPLLVSLGFSAFGAVVLALIANSTAVSFGAVGTPVLLGLGGLGFDSEILRRVTENVGLLHLVGGIIVPLAIVYFVCAFKGGRKKWKMFFDAVPFALFSGMMFVVPYYLFARFVGAELPSIAGALIGLFVVGFSAKKGFLVPRLRISFSSVRARKKYGVREVFVSLMPYILIVLFLSLSRTVGVLKDFLLSFSLGWDRILGVELGYRLSFLYTPSFYFFLTGVISLFIFRIGFNRGWKSLKRAGYRLERPAVALVFTLALVQLFIVSGRGALGLDSIPLLLAFSVAGLTGKFFVFVSPFVGLFGSFIAGSNTVSNLLFGSFQFESALALGLSVSLILALQVVGGAIGNMIAIHNVLAAGASVGYHGEEGRIIRKTIWVALIYALIVGVFGGILVFLG